ncbi:C-C motif chemokine 19-like isoform X2 [Polyodon spathula]|uniref:C-C motif chemokine 19-like isoform X2 n=1 Tax=Polyodon spathula TaxID=7913 RepID=UPI001B7E1085|nr:C-C motif chemokine 19-like isoform X2 [Polyodon spathula]
MAPSITALFLCTFLLYCCSKAYGDSNLVVDCCLRVSNTPIPIKIVKNYKKQGQQDGCDLTAVVFTTKGNRKLCAPPREPWVNSLIDKIDKRSQLCRNHKLKNRMCLNFA